MLFKKYIKLRKRQYEKLRSVNKAINEKYNTLSYPVINMHNNGKPTVTERYILDLEHENEKLKNQVYMRNSELQILNSLLDNYLKKEK